MKRSIVWTMFFVAMLFLSMVAAAKDKEDADDYICTPAMVAGAWGYTETGWVVLPTGAIPYASVGMLTVDRHGNVSGRRTASAAGQIKTGTITGNITVNPDCTGTLTQILTEDTGGSSTAVKAIVFLNNATEAHMIIKPTTLLPVVLSVVAKKVFPGHGDEDER